MLYQNYDPFSKQKEEPGFQIGHVLVWNDVINKFVCTESRKIAYKARDPGLWKALDAIAEEINTTDRVVFETKYHTFRKLSFKEKIYCSVDVDGSVMAEGVVIENRQGEKELEQCCLFTTKKLTLPIASENELMFQLWLWGQQ